MTTIAKDRATPYCQRAGYFTLDLFITLLNNFWGGYYLLVKTIFVDPGRSAS